MKQASSPLPLDLHVLSLSLAFILSQDQTLRCCYLVFLFFLLKKEQRNGIFILLLFRSETQFRPLLRRRPDFDLP